MNEIDSLADIRVLLVPGGGDSGPDHWHTYWQSEDARFERVIQSDWNKGSRDDWVAALDRHVSSSNQPTVLVPYSLGNIVVCHWAASASPSTNRVLGALLVAPADVEAEWAPKGSLYREFRPIPKNALPFATELVASTNDPFLSLARAEEFALAWGSRLHIIEALGHIGSQSRLGNWSEGRRLLDEMIQRLRR
jgi:uncharacterized protein